MLSIARPSMKLLNQDLIRVHVLADYRHHDALSDWIGSENVLADFHVDIAVVQIRRLEDNRAAEEPSHTVEPRLPVVLSLLRCVKTRNVIIGTIPEVLVLSHASFPPSFSVCYSLCIWKILSHNMHNHAINQIRFLSE